MTSYTVPALALLLLPIAHAFAPHPPASNPIHHAAHPAHPPHINQYLEQLTLASLDAEKSDAPSEPFTVRADAITNASTSIEQQQEPSAKFLLHKIKQAGTAGAISYALWELAFWSLSIPICILTYQKLTGHWPDLTNTEDMQKLGAEAFAFVNFARLAVPLRIGLALSTAGWIDENLVKRFGRDGNMMNE